MINSRSLSDLDPVARAVCQKHIEACAAIGIDLLVTSTYRDNESQEALYQIGRTPGDVRRTVTNAKAGHSWHNYRCAWDVVPLVGGKCVWNDTVLWEQIIACGVAAGAEAGALWATFKDKPHFQVVPSGLSFSEATDRMEKLGTLFV